ncbi:expressed unknown protein [Seminavis robusta]|uniref:Uncharacterized protein n=1 Tax=Seminavis robusta TaxID=568900 RepID=A0A9N8E3F3_9STRA|nr:expressed unknown protein [Seminavis robusta]|eukprot:Sro486_g152590.1 n/a (158) ;mRNA; f:22664-23276
MFEKESKILSKFVSFGSKPTAETFPELPDCLIWLRFVLAVSYGVFYMASSAAATDNNQGIIPLFTALNFVCFMPMIYCSLVLQADSESYKGSLVFSGVMNAMALVALIWIYFYTLNHPEEEATLQSLVSLVTDAAGGDDEAYEGDPAPVPPMEESEF